MKCNQQKCPPDPEQILNITRLMENLPSDEDLHQKTELFKALSDVTRLKIIHLLQEGELCVCEIMYALGKPQSTVSHHLNILKNANLIQGRKEGVWIHYKLSESNAPNYLRIITESL